MTPLRSTQPEPEQEPPPARATGLHGAAITAMAVFALLGFAFVLLLITLGWDGGARRLAIAALIFSGIGFMSSAATAVFAAARNTYPQRNDRSRR